MRQPDRVRLFPEMRAPRVTSVFSTSLFTKRPGHDKSFSVSVLRVVVAKSADFGPTFINHT